LPPGVFCYTAPQSGEYHLTEKKEREIRKRSEKNENNNKNLNKKIKK